MLYKCWTLLRYFVWFYNNCILMTGMRNYLWIDSQRLYNMFTMLWLNDKTVFICNIKTFVILPTLRSLYWSLDTQNRSKQLAINIYMFVCSFIKSMCLHLILSSLFIFKNKMLVVYFCNFMKKLFKWYFLLKVNTMYIRCTRWTIDTKLISNR